MFDVKFIVSSTNQLNNLVELFMPDPTSKYKFTFGQQVHHKLFDYYGVIVAVDPCYKGDDQWYEIMARSRPPKENPWYHVKKTDGMETYVAERNLENNPATNN